MRIRNSKNHSAGHLIDFAISNLGLSWNPGKGYHFPDGSYVEYEVEDDIVISPTFIADIQNEYDKLVDANLGIEITVDPSKTFHSMPLRTISFDGQSPSTCGGTHMHSTADLAGFRITKIKNKNGVARVSYVNSILLSN